MLDKSTKKNEDRMCKIVIRDAGMKQDDIARVLNMSQSNVSRPLKDHRESGSITKRKRSTWILECKELLLKHYGIVRPANRDWACQTERCHTLSNKTSLQ